MAAIRLRDIAQDVGVSISAVSQVLRNKVGKVKVSETTRTKIFEAAERLNYEPQAAAKALVTGRTFNIGFLLSAKTTLGLANKFYSCVLSGVHAAAEQRGYSCIVGVYDLSSIDQFIMPAKVRQRKIDAVVITGFVEDAVVQRFVEHGIPFVIIGENAEFKTANVMSSGSDPVNRWKNLFEYLLKLGHRHINFGTIYSAYTQQCLDSTLKKIKTKFRCETFSRAPDGADEFMFGEHMAQEWLSRSERCSAIISNSHFCVGFLDYLYAHGGRCPEDISIVCTNDDVICKRCRPKLTTLSTPEFENAQQVTQVLIDLIEQKIDYTQAQSLCQKVWDDGRLIVRESTAPFRM